MDYVKRDTTMTAIKKCTNVIRNQHSRRADPTIAIFLSMAKIVQPPLSEIAMQKIIQDRSSENGTKLVVPKSLSISCISRKKMKNGVARVSKSIGTESKV